MKYLITLFVINFQWTIVFGQEGHHAHSYAGNQSTMLDIKAEYGDLKIEAWDQDEISLVGNVEINGQATSEVFKIAQHTKGSTMYIRIKADINDEMRVLTINKKDGTTIYKKGKNISIQDKDQLDAESVYFGVDVDANFVLKVPRNLELYVGSTYGNIEINDYFDDLEIENTYGSVEALFDNLPSEPNMFLTSTYSHVDVSIPQSANAELNLSTGYGKIFTDLDFETEKKEQSGTCNFGQEVSALLNDGKGSIKLKADYNNIYLRGIAVN